MARPFDPKLLRRVPAVRRSTALLGVLGVGVAVSIITAGFFLARALTAAADLRLDTEAIIGFLLALAARAALTSGCGAVAARISATVKAQLRADLLGAVGRLGPGWLAGQRAGELATLTGRGLDALDAYFTGYLPQLLLSVTIPVAVLSTLAFADLGSAIIVMVTLPLIPIFGILVGWQTRSATERQWRRLSLLGGHFLDMVAGLPTLRVFGRAKSQVAAVRQMADRYRVATMRTLRIAFLSALVLELVATVSVALVAVPIGLRLLAGGMTLATALLVLLLTPEAYAPLRNAGSRFHASVEGLTALDQAFALLDSAAEREDQAVEQAQAAGAHTAGDEAVRAAAAPRSRNSYGVAATSTPGSRDSYGVAAMDVVELRGVTVEYDRVTALRDVNLTIAPGDRIALIGPSGSGKSTLLQLLLGFVAPTSGRILVGGADLTTMDLDRWRSRLAWVPQHAHLFATTLAGNIALAEPDTDRASVARAASAAALDPLLATLPQGLDTPVGERGYGLSSGERQRLALARAFLRDAPMLLLDEPTARLDAASEQAVVAATESLVTGRTALLVAHRPALLQVATRTVRVEAGTVTELVDA